MIDVVLLLTDDYNNLNKILASLSLQINKEFKVIILDSIKEAGYENTINLFKEKLDINYEITNEKDFKKLMLMAINKSTSKYIMFINEFDVLYDIYSIKNLTKDINDQLIVEGKVIDKNDNEIKNSIYGKIISSDYLRNNSEKLDDILELSDKNNIICKFDLDNLKKIEETIYMKLQ